MLSVIKNDIAYIADTYTVNIYFPRRHIFNKFNFIIAKLDFFTYICDINILFINTHCLAEFRMLLKMFLLTVNRNKIFRLNKAYHQF